MIAPPTLLGGRYRLGALLARGGMADVYEAVDEALDRRVAVKLLRGVEPDHNRRFAGEVAMLARLDHPALVRLYDAGEHDGQPFLVMELVDGSTLATVLRDQGPLGPARTGEVGAALAAGLAAIHRQDVVHRDVKPANVLLSADGDVRLADFGLARLLDAARLTTTGSTIGTPAYLAPEQVEGEPPTPAADIYSLGLVLLECLTGRRVYEGPPVEAAMARLARDPEIPADVPTEWRAQLTGMTARAPGDRPTADDVARDLGSEDRWAPAAAVATTAASAADADDVATQPLPVAAVEATEEDRAGETLVLTGPPAAAGAAAAPAGWWQRSWSPRLAAYRGALLTLAAILLAAVVLAWVGGRDSLPSGSGDDGNGATMTVPITSPVTAPAPPPTAAPTPIDEDGDEDGRGKKGKNGDD